MKNKIIKKGSIICLFGLGLPLLRTNNTRVIWLLIIYELGQPLAIDH